MNKLATRNAAQMPRYYFSRLNKTADPDRKEVELPDLSAARARAIEYLAASLKIDPAAGRWDGDHLFVGVTDEGGSLIFFVAAVAYDGPIIKGAL